jgi:predicted lipoprotein with Yx(FWY)xxD motif
MKSTTDLLRGMRILAAGAVLAAVVLAFAATAMATGGSGTTHKTASVTAAHSPYGTILFDRRGFVLYAFTKDPRGRSVCAGACAKAWPPYIVTGTLAAGKGAAASRLGTIRRRDGSRQATYAGRPLYYYVGDRKPRQILCQNVNEFGGLWLVVRPDGTVVR